MLNPGVLWPFPPDNLMLPHDEVHVWRAWLDAPAPFLRILSGTLTQDELLRAGRFHFEWDRRRFIAARGILRMILGRYLAADPTQLRFSYGSHGRPALAHAPGHELKLDFNLSHSGELAVYAVTRGRRIGVDLELIRVDQDHEELAAQFCSPDENALLAATPAHLRAESFLRCWTRKEAYLKATGEGVSFPPDQVDVARTLSEPLGPIVVANDPQAGAHWSLCELSLDPSYLAALVVEGRDWRLACWQWAANAEGAC